MSAILGIGVAAVVVWYGAIAWCAWRARTKPTDFGGGE